MRDKELRGLRLAVVKRIVALCEDLGKTKMQKITYFLQMAVGAPLKYRFRMHYYGPYSEELDATVSFAQMLGYIDIVPDREGFGFHITPGAHSETNWFDEDTVHIDDVEAIDRATKLLGSLEIVDLELHATIHYIDHVRGGLPKDEILQTVKKLKPKFSIDTIDGAYGNLSEAGLISTAPH